MMQKLPAFILLALATLLGGCASTPKPSGHLVIVGGGLQEDNAAIHERFVQLCADGPIGIVPTASGDGLEAGEEVAARWRKWSGTREVVVIPLTQHDADKASDPAIVKQIDSCGGLWFTGGDQSRIVAVFRPDGKDTPAMLAVRRVLDKGGVVGGTSAGAAMMSDPMITGGRSRSGASTDPENADDRRVQTGPGLGLFTEGLTDQHFLERGRMGRLIDAMRDTGVKMGFGVSENCALVVPLAVPDFFEVIGPHAVCVLDANEPDAFDGNVARVRLDVWSTCKTIDFLAGLPETQELVAKKLGADFQSNTEDRYELVERSGTLNRVTEVESVWSEGEFLLAIAELSRVNSGFVQLRDHTTVLTISADSRTFVIDSGAGLAVIVRLFVEVSPLRN